LATPVRGRNEPRRRAARMRGQRGATTQRDRQQVPIELVNRSAALGPP
jgi:hypothetical protein